jgi:chromosome segregation protein
MQLKQLKLSGFKSFVEPTQIKITGQLIGVVGPNGCGKSNIIDAVRWVMGESSAKTLRGESMTDIIFNGSSNRKPVGQASVELIFDNSLGRLSGQYASYQEISIKRVVTREGDSNYYLNNGRCRKKDITDMFLGTGAGARGYAIIGQDMISRLIEARPEDLKTYFEEAAGISRYKDRRKETLQRISQTRENLARVADIREELAKQMFRLEKQAKSAERYKVLKARERQIKGEISARKWLALESQSIDLDEKITHAASQKEEYEITAHNLAHVESSQVELIQDMNCSLQIQQDMHFQLGTEVARLDETIKQNEKEKMLLGKRKDEIYQEIQEVSNSLEGNQIGLLESKKRLVELEPIVEEMRAQNQVLIIVTEEKECEKKAWETQWQNLQEQLNHLSREYQGVQSQIQNLQLQKQQNYLRIEQLSQEENGLQTDDIQGGLKKLQEEKIYLQAQIQEIKYHQDEISHKQKEVKEKLTTLEKAIGLTEDEYRKCNNQVAALNVAQQAAMNQLNQPEHLGELANLPRALTKFQVESKWLLACELVLGDGLQAMQMENWGQLFSSTPLTKLKTNLYLTSSKIYSPHKLPRLIDFIHGEIPALTGLDSIFIVDSREEALVLIQDLDEHQSVITPEGFWLGKGWLRVTGETPENKQSLLMRQQELAFAEQKLTEVQTRESAQKEERRFVKEELEIVNEVANNLTRQFQALSNEQFNVEGQLSSTQKTWENLVKRAQFCRDEKEDKLFQIQEIIETLEKQNSLLLTIDIKKQEIEQQLELLKNKKDLGEHSRDEVNQSLAYHRDQLNRFQLELERELLKKQHCESNQNRDSARLEQLQHKLNEMDMQYKELESPSITNQLILQHKMQQYQEIDQELKVAKNKLGEVQNLLHSTQNKIKDVLHLIKSLGETLHEYRLDQQALEIKKQSLIDSLAELCLNPQEIVPHLNQEISLREREEEFALTQEKIKRLGAINLIAIEEYQEESERKKILDEQYLDLTQALETLEEAIQKIDKETLTRLNDTFEQINEAFQKLFPRIFGGGKAFLQQTCDNLLDAGILVMAQPPGKRNSTIHMLSGGEKAMTAVALVFAIFQLNPSPFCMLDEVDAPLDDVNVRRFCDLVKEMSEFVQFLFITHNKVTMELADHLIGVTMREPGVSRVVAVDVEQALAIAE